jgi:copper(I)-binding protein
VNAEPVTARRIGLGLAVAAVLLTSACAAGQQAATANQQATLDGVNQSIGSIGLRGLTIEPPDGRSYAPGSDASIKLVIVNSGTKADRLVSISSPVATGWAAYRTTADAGLVEAARSSTAAPSSPAASSSAAGSASASSSASGSTSAAGSASASSPPASSSAAALPLPTPLTSVPIPAGGRVSWGVPEATGALLLVHITKRLYPGTTIQMTFTFANAGPITLAVPIHLSSSGGSLVIPGPSATGQNQ